MTDITYAQASTLTTQDQFRAQTLAQLAAPAAPLQPAPVAGWSESAPQRLLVEDFAADMAVESKIRAKIAACISPQQAVNAGADWVGAVLGWYDIAYIPALPAVVSIPWQVNPTAAPLTVDGSTTIQIQATDGQIFLCTQVMPVVFSSTSSYQGSLQFTARTPGVASNSTSSAILNGKILTAPAGLSMNTGGSVTGVTSGRDLETPQQAIVRAMGKWATLGAGWIRASFDYLIPSFAPSVTSWYVDDSSPLGPGTIQIWLGNATGPASDFEVGLVRTGINSPSVRPVGTPPVTVSKAGVATLSVFANLFGDGSNPSYLTDAANALNLLNRLSVLGPIIDLALVESLLRGLPVGTIDIGLFGGGYKTVTIGAPGFGGVTGISMPTGGFPFGVPSNAVLQVTASLS